MDLLGLTDWIGYFVVIGFVAMIVIFIRRNPLYGRADDSPTSTFGAPGALWQDHPMGTTKSGPETMSNIERTLKSASKK